MGIRPQRVAKLLQREIADILAKQIALDAMVTVTRSRVTKDLGITYIHVSVMDAAEGEREAALTELRQKAGQVRELLAKRLRHQLRRVPEIRFFLDQSLEYAARMDALFEKIQSENEQRAKSRDRG